MCANAITKSDSMTVPTNNSQIYINCVLLSVILITGILMPNLFSTTKVTYMCMLPTLCNVGSIVVKCMRGLTVQYNA